jgi:homoserine trans-succinylase
MRVVSGRWDDLIQTPRSRLYPLLAVLLRYVENLTILSESETNPALRTEKKHERFLANHDKVGW